MSKIKCFVILTLSIILMGLIFNVNVSYGASQIKISKATISQVEEQEYKGKEITPYITVKYEGSTLIKGRDYILEYSNNIKAGTGKITITGIGNYTGTKTKSFKITKRNINNASINVGDIGQYTGNSLKPIVFVKDMGVILKQGTDYSVSYSNNKNAGEAIVKITGKGNYTGTVQKGFKIDSQSLLGVTIKDISEQEYTGEAIIPKLTVKLGTKTLYLDKDYTVTGSNNINIGVATLTITGKGNYKGSISTTFKIVPKEISRVKVEKVSSYEYTGERIRPNVEAYNGNVKLTLGTDYSIAYKNNKKVGTATIRLTGKGNYTGTKQVTFKISKIDISRATVSSISSQYYTGEEIEPEVKVRYDGERLILGEDYTVSYNENINVGTAEIIIRGKGNFTSKITKTFKIKESSYYEDKNLDSDDRISIMKTSVSKVIDQEYTGNSIKPELYIRYKGKILKQSRDYYVTYSNNKEVGVAIAKITGKGDFRGEKTITFNIVKSNSNYNNNNYYSNNNYSYGNISITKTTVSSIYSQKYTGYQIRPNIYLRYNGDLLQEGIDYKLEYSNNINIGYGQIKITGIGNFYGTKTISFKIVR